MRGGPVWAVCAAKEIVSRKHRNQRCYAGLGFPAAGHLYPSTCARVPGRLGPVEARRLTGYKDTKHLSLFFGAHRPGGVLVAEYIKMRRT